MSIAAGSRMQGRDLRCELQYLNQIQATAAAEQKVCADSSSCQVLAKTSRPRGCLNLNIQNTEHHGRGR